MYINTSIRVLIKDLVNASLTLRTPSQIPEISISQFPWHGHGGTYCSDILLTLRLQFRSCDSLWIWRAMPVLNFVRYFDISAKSCWVAWTWSKRASQCSTTICSFVGIMTITYEICSVLTKVISNLSTSLVCHNPHGTITFTVLPCNGFFNS